MPHIDLGDPNPREIDEPYEEYGFTVERIHYLQHPTNATSPPVLDVLMSRRSRRDFGPLNTEQLSNVLWFSCKVLDNGSDSPHGRAWQFRPTPSAGARHPIDILIVEGDVMSVPTVTLYDPLAHALKRLRLPNVLPLIDLLREIKQVLPWERGVIVLFAAQFGRTAAKYEHADSLVWRDAGALIATLGIAAEGLGLACCALGVTCEPWLSQAFETTLLSGVGGCVLGSQC